MTRLKRGLRCLRVAEDGLVRLLPRRAHKGSTWFGRMGDIVQQPPVWVGVAGMLGVAGGTRGRRAAMRGSVCYGVTAIVANLLVKPVVRRSRPPGSGSGRPGPITSSFPSGHAATDLAFALGVAQEVPLLFPPLALATSAAHWSIVRSRGHYPSDVFFGGVLGVAVAFGVWRLWPPGEGAGGGNSLEGSSAEVRAADPNQVPGVGRTRHRGVRRARTGSRQGARIPRAAVRSLRRQCD
ncbi:MAG: phosphatase PAP2 family protein [Actinobacteria bacterium]|nr:phosphatase PAP2 family protein [Actinomycetota bacterium]